MIKPMQRAHSLRTWSNKLAAGARLLTRRALEKPWLLLFALLGAVVLWLGTTPVSSFAVNAEVDATSLQFTIESPTQFGPWPVTEVHVSDVRDLLLPSPLLAASATDSSAAPEQALHVEAHAEQAMLGQVSIAPFDVSAGALVSVHADREVPQAFQLDVESEHPSALLIVMRSVVSVVAGGQSFARVDVGPALPEIKARVGERFTVHATATAPELDLLGAPAAISALTFSRPREHAGRAARESSVLSATITCSGATQDQTLKERGVLRLHGLRGDLSLIKTGQGSLRAHFQGTAKSLVLGSHREAATDRTPSLLTNMLTNPVLALVGSSIMFAFAALAKLLSFLGQRDGQHKQTKEGS